MYVKVKGVNSMHKKLSPIVKRQNHKKGEGNCEEAIYSQ